MSKRKRAPLVGSARIPLRTLGITDTTKHELETPEQVLRSYHRVQELRVELLERVKTDLTGRIVNLESQVVRLMEINRLRELEQRPPKRRKPK